MYLGSGSKKSCSVCLHLLKIVCCKSSRQQMDVRAVAGWLDAFGDTRFVLYYYYYYYASHILESQECYADIT
jgi:hypothetical protein